MQDSSSIFLKKTSLLFFSVLFLIFLFPGSPYLSTRLITPHEFLFLAGVISFTALALLASLQQKRFFVPFIFIPMLIFAACRFIPVVYAPLLNPHATVSKAIGIITGLLFFLAILQARPSQEGQNKILFVVFLSAVLQALIGIAQYSFPSLDLSPFLMKFDGQVYGSFQQPNLFASWIATGIVLSLSSVFTSRLESPKSRAPFFLAVFSMGFVLALTGSRLGILGIVCGSLVLLFSQRDAVASKKRLVILWATVLVIALVCGTVSEKIKTGEIAFAKKSASMLRDGIGERETLYKTASLMFLDKPLGQGVGNFGSLYPVYEREMFKKWHSLSPKLGYSSHPHNEVLYIAAESGLVGIAGVIVFGVGCIVLLRRLGFKRGGFYLALLTPLLIHSQLEYPFYQSLPHWMLFLLLLSFPSTQYGKELQVRLNEGVQRAMRISLAALSAVAVILIIITSKDYKSMMVYVSLTNEKRVVDLRLLESSLRNPYLKEEAERLKMQALLDYGVRNNDQALLEMVLQWAEVRIKKTPTPTLYHMKVTALLGAGKMEQAFKILEETLSLYPQYKTEFPRIPLPKRTGIVSGGAGISND